MVRLGLQISARLENVEKIDVCGEDFRYFIKTSCTNCGEISDKWQYVSLELVQEGRTGRQSECQMKSKCKGCRREVSLVIHGNTVNSYVYDENKPENFQTIVIFEGRGMDVLDFDFRSGWNIKALNSTTVFENADFSEKEWVEYDEKSSETVGVYDLKAQIIKLK